MMYKIRCKTDIFQSIFSIHWDFAAWQLCQFGSNKLIEILTGLDVSYFDRYVSPIKFCCRKTWAKQGILCAD